MADSSWVSRVGQVSIGELSVNRIGLGTNRITDTEEAHKLLNRALELGVNFIDTAHRYGDGASETTIGNTLSPYKPGLVIATKGGADRSGEDATPQALRRDLEESLVRLKTDHIILYQLHRVDPKVPIEESVSALKDFRSEGKILHVGLSNVSLDQIKQAQAIVPIVSIQNHYNVLKRDDEEVVDYCSKNNIAFIPWFPLGGLAGGAEEVAAKLAKIANRYSASPQQIALAWLLKRSKVMLPIPGTLSIEHLEANLSAAEIQLSDEDYSSLN